MLHTAARLAVLPLLLASGPRATTLDEAKWQPLLPGAERGPQLATVVASATLSQTLLRLPKDTALPQGRHDADATLAAVEGELAIEAQGKTFLLTPGTVLELPAGTRYGGRTKWDKKAMVLITLAGPWSRLPG